MPKKQSNTLSDRSIERLRALLRASEASDPPRAASGQPRDTLPVLARAVEFTPALTSGAFQVQSATPDSLGDSGQTRTAYALSEDIEANALVSLVWHASPGSGGFFAAMAVGAGGSSSACDVCGIIDLIDQLHVLNADQQASVAEIRESCGCGGGGGSTCPACDNGEVADRYSIEIAGFSISNPFLDLPNADWLTLRDWLMQPRTAEPFSQSGFCTVDFDFGATIINGRSFTLGNQLVDGALRYRVLLAPRFPNASVTPNPIVYRDGFQFFVIANPYDGLTRTNCLDSRSFVSSAPDGDTGTSIGNNILTTTVEPVN